MKDCIHITWYVTDLKASETAGRDIQGYLHNLSELKTSIKNQRSYFTAVLQTGPTSTSYSDMVYFGTENYIAFRDLFKSGTAVQMKNVKLKTTAGRRVEKIECDKSCKFKNTVLRFFKIDPPQQDLE